MNNHEFDLIQQYFTFPNRREDVDIYIGDDCASVKVASKKQLLITTDTLIENVHFPQNTTAADIAYKALIVNLSDLAAMGATPAWITLAVSLPTINHHWLSQFSQTLGALLAQYKISLIGGDTTRGHLSITITAMGFADKDKLLKRDKARVGDKIYVTGNLGDAAIGLQVLQKKIVDENLQSCISQLNRPQIALDFSLQLHQYSQCAIDLSDGLIADLGHILKASNCGAKISLAQIPVSDCAHYYFKKYQNNQLDWALLLTQGDDYKLCFTAAPQHQSALHANAKKHHSTIFCIGEITKQKKIQCLDLANNPVVFEQTGFSHF